MRASLARKFMEPRNIVLVSVAVHTGLAFSFTYGIKINLIMT